MKILFIFLFCVLATSVVFTQEAYDPNRTYKVGDQVLINEKDGVCDCPNGFYPNNKKGGGIICVKWGEKKTTPKKQTTKVVPAPTFRPEHDPLYDVVKKHGQVLDDHENRISNVEAKVSDIEKTVFKPEETPETPHVEVQVEEEKPPPDITVGAKEEVVDTPLPKWYKWGVAPFVEIGGVSNHRPDFLGKFLWGTSVGLTIQSRFTDGPAKGLGFALSPGYHFAMKKEFIVETDPSPYPENPIRLNGFIAQGRVSYTLPLEKLEISPFLGYSYSPNKELSQGANAGLELGAENFPIKLYGGVLYNNNQNLDYFFGIKLTKEFWF
ncbi:MAG: hypothetical protein M3P22_02945 [bacterium]|nr:hypothetical protein [bacterium]